MWAADYVLADYGTGAIMAVPGPRPARPGLRQGVRPAGAPRGRHRASGTPRRPTSATTGDGDYVNSGPLDGLSDKAAGIAAHHRAGWRQTAAAAARSTSGCATGCCPAALLGRADPDRALPRPAARSRCPRTSCRCELPDAAGRGPEAQGRLAAGGGDRLGQRRLPAVRRTGHARHRHDGHLRGLVVVLPALLLAAATPTALRRRGGARLDAGRAVRRRRRARDPAPALQPVLHQGAARHGDDRLRRAVHRAAEPGPGDQRGQGDEQVAGQRRQPGRDDRRATASTRSA